MKKHSFQLLLFALFLGVSSQLLASETVHGESGQTKGDIQFFQDDSPEEPVDPENPDDPITPNYPPTPGPYSLSYASNLIFGTQQIMSKDQTYFASLDTVTTVAGEQKQVPNFIQLTDKSGTNKGWRLTAHQSVPFTNEKGFVLSNTRFVFSNLVAKGVIKEALTPSGVPNDTVTLESGNSDEVLIAEAGKDTGQGTWTIQFGADNEEGKQSVALIVPEKTEKKVGTYKAEILWSLTNGL